MDGSGLGWKSLWPAAGVVGTPWGCEHVFAGLRAFFDGLAAAGLSEVESAASGPRLGMLQEADQGCAR